MKVYFFSTLNWESEMEPVREQTQMPEPVLRQQLWEQEQGLMEKQQPQPGVGHGLELGLELGLGLGLGQEVEFQKGQEEEE